MARHRLAEKAKLKQHWSAETIALALNSRWGEAAAVNRNIIELFPDDIEATSPGKLARMIIRTETREKEAHSAPAAAHE